MLYQPTAPHFSRPLASTLTGEAKLHVCTMISNPVRYSARYKLYENFVAQNDGPHVDFWLVEVAFGNRPFVLTERDNPHHLQLRTRDEIWHKENALNLLFAHVLSEVPDAEYLAWVDADLTFVRSDWAYETLQQLQHYDVVQMFSHAQDVGPKYEPLDKQFQGFVWSYYNSPNFDTTPTRFGYTVDGHPGYAWAARKTALDTMGGLLDFAICGGADRHMACALLGTVDHSGPDRRMDIGKVSPEFKQHLHLWQENALLLNKNIGYVDGLINHHWHGRKTDRQYGSRWKIYTNNQYDPTTDLKRDAQGLYQLRGNKVQLRDDLRSYLRARNEDSLEVVK
jgi:hypothetical protein